MNGTRPDLSPGHGGALGALARSAGRSSSIGSWPPSCTCDTGSRTTCWPAGSEWIAPRSPALLVRYDRCSPNAAASSVPECGCGLWPRSSTTSAPAEKGHHRRHPVRVNQSLSRFVALSGNQRWTSTGVTLTTPTGPGSGPILPVNIKDAIRRALTKASESGITPDEVMQRTEELANSLDGPRDAALQRMSGRPWTPETTAAPAPGTTTAPAALPDLTTMARMSPGSGAGNPSPTPQTSGASTSGQKYDPVRDTTQQRKGKSPGR
ncbi:hypothetical protein RKD31_000824 [Streptomyces sp. SAI-163]